MHGTGILDAGLGDVYSLLHATGTCIYRSTQIGCNRRGVAVVSSWIGDELYTAKICRTFERKFQKFHEY